MFGFRGIIHKGLDFKVQWVCVPNFEFRVSGFGFQVLSFVLLVSGFGFRASGFGFRVSAVALQLSGSDFGFQVP